MSDPTMQADPSDDAIVSAIDLWSAQAGLSALGADAPILVLDKSGVRVLYASPAAEGLRAGLARADGRIAPGVSFPALEGKSARVGERPRLVRLRLDPRGIAASTTCLVARIAVEDATTVLIVAPTGPVPVLRPLAGGSDGARPWQPPPPIEPVPSDETVVPPAAPRMDGRIVWQSDEANILRRVSGDETVARALTGRSWPDLFAGGTMEGEPLSAAIAGRATFRALEAAVVVPGGAETIEIDWSGAPTARAHQPFAGFAGFGLIRGRRPIEVQPMPPPPIDNQDADTAPASVEGSTLSATEHAAFREIARSLGSRFASDHGVSDQAQDKASEPPIATPRGSVTPFPISPRLLPVGPSAAELLDGLPIGALIHREAAILYVNPRALAMSGCPDLPALRASNAFAGLMREAQPDEGGTDDVVSVRTATGAVVPAILDRADIAWEGRRATLLLVRPAATAGEPIPGEMSPDREALDAIRADAARVLDSLPDGVLTLDEGGRILTLNGRAEGLLGRQAPAIIDQGLAGLFPRDAEPTVAAAIERAKRVGAWEGHVVMRGGDDTPVPVFLRVVRLPEGGARFCVTMRDRSEAEAGEAEIARQAETAATRKADFLAKVSHEIRTPLNNILGFADVMLSEPHGPLGAERDREYLRDIHASGSHVLRVVDDLVDLARIEAGRVDLSFTEIPLNDLVSGCITLMQPQAARDRIVVRTSFTPDLTTLVADERSIRQAALNVIANAIRFTEAGGQVIVSTTIAERGEVALRVRDTGIGMTTEEVEDALHPFRRIGVSGPAPGGGTGLGLTLTKALVEANRGRFRITSRKDEGTLVEMLFPVADARLA